MITESKTKSPIADDLSQMRVVLSMPCRRCGYELKELEADGDCPECGEPIRLTIIEAVDPTSRRLQPIHKPKTVGNLIAGAGTLQQNLIKDHKQKHGRTFSKKMEFQLD